MGAIADAAGSLVGGAGNLASGALGMAGDAMGGLGGGGGGMGSALGPYGGLIGGLFGGQQQAGMPQGMPPQMQPPGVQLQRGPAPAAPPAPPPDYASQTSTQLPSGMSQQGAGVGEQKQQMNEAYYSTPGQAENVQAQQAGYYAQPQTGAEATVQGMIPGMQQQGLGQQAIGSIMDQGMGNVGAANPTAQAYQQFQQNRPDIAQDPGLDPYYENAQRRALEAINKNAGARGMYGSSAALAQGQEAITDLAAEQANREADYNLKRMAEQRGWEGLGGQMAGQQAGSQLGWAQGLGGMGLGAEGMDMARGMNAAQLAGMQQGMLEGRMGHGFNQAMGAQGAGMQRHGQGFGEAVTGQNLRDSRIQNMLNNQFQRESLYAPMVGNWGQGVVGQDIDLLNAQMGGGMATAQERQRQQQGRNQQFRTDLDTGMDLASSIYGMV